MYSANDIAKWFIEKGIDSGKPFTPMQIIKLTYIAQGTHLAIYSQPLFNNSIEAWKYGPVVKAVYQRVKDYGKDPIPDTKCMEDVKGVDPSDKETLTVLQSVLNVFGSQDGLQLSTWTHRQGSAWDKAYHKQGGYNLLGYEIDLNLLKEEFDPLVKQHKTRTRLAGWAYVG